MKYTTIPQTDPQVFEILQAETTRQREGLDLIPSENYVSPAVLEVIANVFTNKYSEGYPGHRYYGGQTYSNEIESLTIERAKNLFSADHASVQPLSGANANLAAYIAWLQPGDTILAMDLSHGGHLTHGSPVTFSAAIYRFIHYKMKDVSTGEIDYDALRDQALKEKPKLILAGLSAYPRTLNYKRIAEIAQEVGALAMADMAHLSGLIAAKVLPNPLNYGFNLMTTTTHKSLRGPRGAIILTKGIVSNPLKKPEKTLENIPTLIDRAIFPGLQGGPHMHKIAAICVALKEAASPDFQKYAQQILKNAQALSAALQKLGAKLITNGTDNHLMLINTMESFGKNGDQIQTELDEVNITLNKNSIPDDPLPPFKSSGARLGTPAATTRGMKEPEMAKIANWIIHIAKNGLREAPQVKKEVRELCLKFPPPQ